MNEDEEFEFRARAEKEASSSAPAQKEMGGKAPFWPVAKATVKELASPSNLAKNPFIQGALPILGGRAGGPIGAAGGELLRQALATAVSPERVPKTGLGRFGSVATAGLLQEPGRLMEIPGMDKMARGVEAIKKPIGSGLSKFGEMYFGVPARQFGRLWKDPKALFRLKTLDQAGDEFGAALKKEGIDVTPTSAEINDPQLSTARKNTKGFFDKLKNGIKTDIEIPYLKTREVEKAVPKDYNPIQVKDTSNVKPFATSQEASIVPPPGPTLKATVEPQQFTGKYQPSPADILKARRGTDRIIAGTPWKDKTGLHNLYNQRGQLNEMFENASGPGTAASKDYARSALASNFRKLLPETQTGKISYVKSVLTPLATRAAFLGSPALAGLITSGASLSAEAIEKSPVLRQAIAQAMQAVQRKPQGQQ